MKKSSALFLLFVFLLAACTSLRSEEAANDPWWEHAVFYEIFVRSFYDSDCDGMGDFNGITHKLDYLQDLGVNALWLMPIHPSSSYHGYDVTDYYAVNPEYGTMEDFKKLVAEAHQRDIHIIIDLVLNHTSNQHPWFLDANSSPDSSFRDWYIWSDTYPGYNGPLGTAWHSGNDGYYYGVFWSGMPDLNYTNPEVTNEMYDVTRYWLTEIGVDGFRIDAAKHLIEEGENQENTDSTHAWFRDFYTFYKRENSRAYAVGEVFGAGAFFAKTYTGDQFDQVFNFDLAYGFINSANNGKKQAANSAVTFTLKDISDGQYASFLTNHDQDRVMTVLGGDFNTAQTASSLLLTAPGTPFIYYGEEIGLHGKKPDEDIRRPMQWSADPNAGFSCPEAQPWRPPYDDYAQVNVAAQLDEEESLFRHYQKLISLRKASPALKIGATTLVDTDNQALFSALRTTDTEQILVLINLGEQPIPGYHLSLTESPLLPGRYEFEDLLNDLVLTVTVNESGGFSLAVETLLQPYQTVVAKAK